MTPRTPHDARYPRPTLVRENWTDLCGTWQFAYDDEDVGRDARWQDMPEVFDRAIEVPFPPESKASGVGAPGFHPVIWYRLETTVERAAGRTLLHFGAVDYRAQVWVNGDLVAEHVGGHTPFSADITASLGERGTQVIVVRAEDRPHDAGQPRGKQDWQEEPHAIWYQRTSGIWQPVWLEVVPDIHVEKVHFVPDLARHCVSAEITLNAAPPEDTTCELTIFAGEQVVARQRITAFERRVVTTITIPALEHGEARGHLLWTPERPNLLDVDIAVAARGERVDTCKSYFGLRSCTIADKRFMLNNRPYFIRAVLEQGYWPDSHLAAPSAEALREEVEWIKALGFNTVRVHQKVEDPRFLYWCDRLGVMVWGEMPSAYAFSAETVDRFTREWMSVIDRDRSHPSIVTWVPLNESWGIAEVALREDQQAYATGLYHITKALDPTRPVISNDGWEHTQSDIVGIHDYSVEGEHLKARYATPERVDSVLSGLGPQRRRVQLTAGALDEQPVMITEFGGISYQPVSGEAWFGYGTVSSAQEYIEAVEALFDGLHASPALAGYCYTQLTDTLQERNGLLDENRTPKLDLEALRAIINRPSQAIAAEFLDIERNKALQKANKGR